MRAKVVYFGLWRRYWAVKHILCSDGHRRYAKLAPEADTFFSVPARVKVKGKTVSGYATAHGEGDWAFHAYEYGKNGHLLPNEGFKNLEATE